MCGAIFLVDDYKSGRDAERIGNAKPLFVDEKTANGCSYLYPVESVRENGRTKQRIICNLGRKEVALASGALDRLIASIGRFGERSPVLCAGSARVCCSGGCRMRAATDRWCPSLLPGTASASRWNGRCASQCRYWASRAPTSKAQRRCPRRSVPPPSREGPKAGWGTVAESCIVTENRQWQAGESTSLVRERLVMRDELMTLGPDRQCVIVAGKDVRRDALHLHRARYWERRDTRYLADPNPFVLQKRRAAGEPNTRGGMRCSLSAARGVLK